MKKEMRVAKETKAPCCPQCPKGQDQNVGSEYKGEWVCYSCGFQWLKTPEFPRR